MATDVNHVCCNTTNDSVRQLCVSDRYGSEYVQLHLSSQNLGCFPSDSSATHKTIAHDDIVSVCCSSKILLSVLSRKSKQFSDRASTYYMYQFLKKKGFNFALRTGIPQAINSKQIKFRCQSRYLPLRRTAQSQVPSPWGERGGYSQYSDDRDDRRILGVVTGDLVFFRGCSSEIY